MVVLSMFLQHPWLELPILCILILSVSHLNSGSRHGLYEMLYKLLLSLVLDPIPSCDWYIGMSKKLLGMMAIYNNKN